MKKVWQLVGHLAFWATWPALWAYLHGTKRTRVIVTAGDKVLLVKAWLGAGQWILPGGGIHRHESPLQAAAREVREETGLQLDPVDFKTLDTIAVREYGIDFSCTVYVVDIADAADLQPANLEITDAIWSAKTELDNLSPLTRQLLANWS